MKKQPKEGCANPDKSRGFISHLLPEEVAHADVTVDSIPVRVNSHFANPNIDMIFYAMTQEEFNRLEDLARQINANEPSFVESIWLDLALAFGGSAIGVISAQPDYQNTFVCVLLAILSAFCITFLAFFLFLFIRGRRARREYQNSIEKELKIIKERNERRDSVDGLPHVPTSN